MATFSTKCPHCGISVEVQTEWLGRKGECPGCRKVFIISSPVSAKIPDSRLDSACSSGRTASETNPAQADNKPQPPDRKEKTQYPWGRRYIALARIFAGLMLFLGLVLAADGFREAFSLRRELLDALRAKSEKPLSLQKPFKEHFERLAEVVLTGNQSTAKFRFPSDLSSTEHEFNDALMTEEDISESLAAAEDYAGKLKTISAVLTQYFQASSHRIEEKLHKGNSLRVRFNRPQRNTSLALHLSQKIDFYSLPDSDVRAIIQAAFNELDRLAASSYVDVKAEAADLRRGLTFIEKTLCSNSTGLAIRGRTYPEQTEQMQTGQRKLQYETELFRRILTKLRILCNYNERARDQYIWQLTEELSRLQSVLRDHEQEIKDTRRKIRGRFWQAAKNGSGGLIASLILAFLIMVIADFLQAHLDSADHLYKICGKGMSLLVLLLLTGCGPAPEDLLVPQKETLKSAAIDNMFYQAIAAQNNQGAVLYGQPGIELTMINGGIPAHGKLPDKATVPHIFTPVALGRTYNIIRLRYTVPSGTIKFNPVKKIDKPPYTHRTMMVFKARQELTSGEEVPGLQISALVPEGFGNWYDDDKENWLKKYYDRLPADDCDHAIVIAQTPFPGTAETVTRNFEILFNSKTLQWELKNKEKIESLQSLPKYDARKKAALLQTCGFHPIIATCYGADHSRKLYLEDKDCEIIRKLNAGQILVNGRWIVEKVYRQNLILGKVIERIRNDSELTWPKLETFAEVIGKNPLAENRHQANTLLISCFEREINNRRHEKAILLRIIEKLRLPCFRITDEKEIERLIDQCRKHIEELNTGERIRLATDQKQQEKMRDGLQEMRNAVRTDFNSMLARAKALYLLDNPEFLRHYNLLRTFIMLKGKNRATFSELVKKHQWKIGEYDFRSICQHCHGKGKEPCSFCKSTGICRICKGTGVRQRYNSVLVDGNTDNYEVECPRECTYCNGQKKLCRSCRGLTGFLDKAAVNEAIEKESDKFCAWIDMLIEQISKRIEETNRQYENVGK